MVEIKLFGAESLAPVFLPESKRQYATAADALTAVEKAAKRRQLALRVEVIDARPMMAGRKVAPGQRADLPVVWFEVGE